MKFFKFIIILNITFAIIAYFGICAYAESTTYVWSNNANEIQTTAEPNLDENNSLELESASAILIEQTTGQVLYSHNVHEQLRPASVTKVMSILLIMEQIDSRKTFFNRYCKLF